MRGRKISTQTYRLVLLGIALSFLGWCFEKLGRLLVFGGTGDRGFLTLPLCPIYGIGIISVFLLVGVPARPSGIIVFALSDTPVIKKLLRSSALRFICYFLFVTLLSGAIELVTGLAAAALGRPLWDYSGRPFQLFGVICLEFCLLWGALITLFMTFFFSPLYRLTQRISPYIVKKLSVSLIFVMFVDFTVAFFRVLGAK